MDDPLTAEELRAAAAVVAVRRPLHWDLARRLIREILRLRSAALDAIPIPKDKEPAAIISPRAPEPPVF